MRTSVFWCLFWGQIFWEIIILCSVQILALARAEGPQVPALNQISVAKA